MKESKIEWCTHTENPFTGCSHGCKYCYARRMAHRWSYNTRTKYHKVSMEFGNPFVPTVHLDLFDKLHSTLERARHRRDIFLGSMSDMCCKGPWFVMRNGIVHDGETRPEWLQRKIQWLIRNHVRHTFYMLTKAPANLTHGWPDNARIGVSVSHSDAACDMRLARFRRGHPAMFKWVSVEPLMDPDMDPRMLFGMNWIVVGGQTGVGAPRLVAEHPLVLAAKRIVEWCEMLNLPCFVKSNMRNADHSFPWPKQIPPGCVLGG